MTKVATTLALLQQLGPQYRFETRVLAAGVRRDGVLDGDLVVEAGSDPVLVYENAFVILGALRSLGLRRVEGRLRVRGPLIFNWRSDPAGRRLQRVLSGLDGAAAWPAVQAERKELAGRELGEVGLAFGGRRGSERHPPAEVLVVHGSPPLTRIVKVLNGYSNNVFHPLSEHIGGPAAVQRIARERVAPAMRAAIVIDNAAGAGKTNRLSPRAVVALLEALDREVSAHGLSLVDVLPVAGIDPGTLRDRLDDPAHRGTVVGKTGTIGSLGVSALAGVMRTRRYGQVTFALLNRGVPIAEARRRQDAFTRALARAGDAVSWPYRRGEAPAFTEARLDGGD